LLAVLCTYADRRGRCWPSDATLANRLGASVRSVQRWLRELATCGALVRERQFRDGLETVSATRIVFSRGDRTFSPAPRSDTSVTPGVNEVSYRTPPVEQHQSTPPGKWSFFSSDSVEESVGQEAGVSTDHRDWMDADLTSLPVEMLNNIVFGSGPDPAV
jgi:hypothetical protein